MQEFLMFGEVVKLPAGVAVLFPKSVRRLDKAVQWLADRCIAGGSFIPSADGSARVTWSSGESGVKS